MEVILTHGCCEYFFGEECVSSHDIGYFLQPVFSADKIVAIPIYEVFIDVLQRFTIYCLYGTQGHTFMVVDVNDFGTHDFYAFRYVRCKNRNYCIFLRISCKASPEESL